MAAHRWWRIFITANQGNAYTSLAELTMHQDSEGPNRCRGGTPISSPFYQDSVWFCSPTKAFDSDPAPQSFWHTRDYGVLPAWLGYGFSDAIEIQHITMTFRAPWENQHNVGQAPRDFAVQWSDNGSSWTTCAGFAGLAPWTYSETRAFSLAPAQPQLLGLLSRVAPGAVNGPPQPRALGNRTAFMEGLQLGPCALPLISRQNDFHGIGRIEGVVSIEGTPAARKVRLFDSRTSLLVAETWSQPNGRYRFDLLDLTRDYFVLSHDHTAQFNAVIADRVRPEPTVYP